MRSAKILLLSAVAMVAAVLAQDLTAISYIKKPRATVGGVVCTDENFSALYHFDDDSVRELLRGKNVGQYYTIDAGKQKIGVKLIDEDGRQTPAVLDIQTGNLTRLRSSAKQIGQVSFTNDGPTAYTAGENLIVSDGRTVNLGYYANLAPISPDGESVCFNDANDQIWLMKINSQSKIQISDGQDGYYQPRWSPDSDKILYSAFTGAAKIYELATGITYSIASADDPNWGDDSETIIFSRKEIAGYQLINADIFTAKYTGESVKNVTGTSGVLESEATFGLTQDEIIYQTAGAKAVQRVRLDNSKDPLDETKTETIKLENVAADYSVVENNPASYLMDVPYLHQVYDVPNWFWGYYACAPTTAAMLLAYYNILPVWETTCSSPSSHISKWGRYICEQYYYREVNYTWSSSPNGHTAGKGGYGYMWGTGSPNSKMADYYRNHGLTAQQIWPSNMSTTWTAATSEIKNGYPYSMCVWLTSSGHLVLARGIVEGQHSLVFNDPYGNRNGSSYPAYNGNGVIYDWPGYNEGNANLAYAGTGIPWCISASYTVPSVSDSLIDDLNLANGFTLNTAAPASMIYWKDKKTGGYNGHFWYTNSRIADTCSAEWSAPPTRVGLYAVEAFIPTSSGLSSSVKYRIRNGAGESAVVIDQNANQGKWVGLGNHYFDVGRDCAVMLTDSTGEKGDTVAFDAMKWRFLEEPSLGITFNSYTGEWYREGPPKTIFFQGSVSYLPDYVRVRWDFGDGCTADSLNPEHVFRAKGSYTVVFTAIFGDESFSIDTTIVIEPAAATDFSLLIPEDEAVITTAQPLFYWIPKALKKITGDSQKSRLLDGYRSFSLYLNHNSAFHEVEPIVLDTNLYRPSTPLTENAEYFWTVVAEDTAGNKLLSPVWSFIINTENSAPENFALLAPAEKEVVTVLKPQFTWNSARDVDPREEITYRLKIGTALNDLAVYYEGNDTTCILGDSLTDNAIYYWQVTATDAVGVTTGNEGGFGEFGVNTTNDPPSAVTLLTPQNGAGLTTQYPLFLWEAAQDADPYEKLEYQLYYWRNDFNYTYLYTTDTTYCDRRKVLSNRVYHWCVMALDAAGATAVSDTFMFTTGNVQITAETNLPKEFALHQNFPNPFNPITTIAFDLPEETEVTISIYDLTGREVATLVRGRQPAGYFETNWYGRDKMGRPVPSGVYLYSIRTSARYSAVKKMVLVR